MWGVFYLCFLVRVIAWGVGEAPKGSPQGRWPEMPPVCDHGPWFKMGPMCMRTRLGPKSRPCGATRSHLGRTGGPCWNTRSHIGPNWFPCGAKRSETSVRTPSWHGWMQCSWSLGSQFRVYALMGLQAGSVDRDFVSKRKNSPTLLNNTTQQQATSSNNFSPATQQQATTT